jgi:hypothetical protein
MSRLDIKLRTPVPGYFTQEMIVAAGAAGTVLAGEPTVKGEATGTSTGIVATLPDGDPLTTSTHQFSGIAKNDSTDPVAAAGLVTVWMPLAGIIYSAKTKLSTDANTLAKVRALRDKRVVLDKTGGVYTVDSAATDSKSNGIFIVDGDFRTQEIFFMVTNGVTFFQSIAEA